MRLDIIKCDLCGAVVDNATKHWSNKTAGGEITITPDGINGGIKYSDLCAECRGAIYEALLRVIQKRKDQGGKR